MNVSPDSVARSKHDGGANTFPRAVPWSRLLWLTLAYFAVAQLSLQLAFSSTLAVPLWPATGLALLGLLVWGCRCWPAVWLAAFVSDQLIRYFATGGEVSAALVALSATIATGVALQALLGARLMRPFIASAEPLEQEHDVFAALALGGPLACLVSATIAMTGLYVFQGLPIETLGASWIIWWAGDSLGVLLLASMLLPVLPATRHQWRGRALQLIVPPLVTCGLAVMGYVWLDRVENAAWQKTVTASGEPVRDMLALRMTRQTQRIMAVSDLFQAGIAVSDAEFEQFSRRALTLDGLHAMAWAPRVARTQRATVEAGARARGRSDFIIRERDTTGRMQPAGERAEYFPFLFVATPSGHSSAFGLDVASEPGQRTFLERAADHAEAVWVERDTFYDQDADRKDDWRLYVPVYHPGFDAQKASPEARRAALRGFAVGVFYQQEIFASLSDIAAQHRVVYRISDPTVPGVQGALFDARPSDLKFGPADWKTAIEGLDGGNLLLEVWSLSPWQAGQSAVTKIYLIGSVLVVLFVTAFVLVAAGQNVRVTRRVAERTAELSDLEARLRSILDNMAAFVGETTLDGVLVEINHTALAVSSLRREDVIGKRLDQTWWFSHSPEVQAQTREDIERAQRGEMVRHDVLVRMASGALITIDFMLVPVRDSEGRVIKLIPSAIDITERKQVEMEVLKLNENLENLVAERTAALYRNEREFRATFERAAMGIAHISHDGLFVRVNPRLCEISGYTESELLNKALTDIQHPDDIVTKSEGIEHLLRGEIPSFTLEKRLIHKDGTPVWIYLTASVVRDEDGAVAYIIGFIDDISARKCVEEALKSNQALLKETGKVAKVGGWEFYLDTQELKWTEEVYRIHEVELAYKQTVSEAINFYAPTSRPIIERAVQRAIEHGDPYDVELELITAKGNRRWVHCIGEADQKHSKVFGIFQDITASKQAEQATIDLADELKATLQAIPDLLYELDENGRYHNVWSGNESLVSRQKERVIGRTVVEIMPAEAAQTVLAVLAETITTGVSHGHQISLPLPRGTYWFELSAAVKKNRPGEARRIVLLSRNVTARKANETNLQQLTENLESMVTERTNDLNLALVALAAKAEEIRSVVEHMADCVITTDVRGVIRSANRALENIFGWSVSEVIGQNVSILMPQALRSAHDEDLAAYRRTGQSKIMGIGRQIDGMHKDGTPIALELGLSEYTVNGERFFTGIMRDIRERVQIMSELQQARLEAEKANQTKSAFLATMSHEIRTPMNGVIGMVDVLEETNLKRNQLEMVDLIRVSALSLLDIIDDILDFSKIEAGKLDIESAPVPVADVVEKTCSMLDQLAMNKRVELTLFTDPAIPAEVMGDAVRLRQVLVNLTNNAVKFSSGQQRQGRVSVRALLAASNPNQVMVEFQVADNGIGMDESTQARLFTAFTQADASTTRRFGGTGLGLAISHHLVELMGGKIAVQSTPGKGTIFSVRLPFAPSLTKANGAGVDATAAGLSCLVVGDTEGLAGDLSVYLSSAGATVEQAPDLNAIRKRSDSQSPSLWVWVIDAGETRPSPDALRAAALVQPERDAHFIIIGRGKRRQPRLQGDDMVTVDGNVLHRRTFLKTVAMAAGRMSAEGEKGLPEKIKAEIHPPSREQALREGQLILVAEDNETNQKVILQQLALLGYAADVAGDGRQALACWKSGDYALLLTDLHMPEMDGYDLTLAIRSEEVGKRRIPIVALTANALKDEAKRGRAMGMDDYLSKPARLMDLKAMLIKWLPAAAVSGLDLAVSAIPSDGAGPVNVRDLEALVGDDPAVIREFLQDFRISAAKAAAELKRACEAEAAAEAGAAAHKLKSSARSVGARALGDLCEELEQAGNAGRIEVLATLLPKFMAEMTTVDNYLDALSERKPE